MLLPAPYYCHRAGAPTGRREAGTPHAFPLPDSNIPDDMGYIVMLEARVVGKFASLVGWNIKPQVRLALVVTVFEDFPIPLLNKLERYQQVERYVSQKSKMDGANWIK